MSQHREHGDTEAGAFGLGPIRQNALWGRTKKVGSIVLATMLVAAFAVLAGLATPAQAAKENAYVPQELLAAASVSPDGLFDVIVQGSRGKTSDEVENATKKALDDDKAKDAKFKRKFASISGVSATLTGKQLLKLADKSDVDSITRDSKIELQGFTSTQVWPSAAGVTSSWSSLPDGLDYPAIAVVDSGITGLTNVYGNRLVKSVSIMSSWGASGAYGHGTFVGSIAASQDPLYGGAEPRAKIVSIKVLDGAGNGAKSDVIAACDWILANKATYNIRVANFSLLTGGDSIRYDALDKAVEKLWLNGVVVVAAAGNYAVNGAKSDVGFAPANDPFVITVGASDTNNTTGRSDDFAAPWSAWGWTQDGFFKPEVAAPGRRMVGAVPTGANLLTQFPDRVVGPNNMWMSGTSFAAPVVSGIAASLLAKNPSWTPDQVKGAIMLGAKAPGGYGSNGGLGLGVVGAEASLASSGAANPNAGLNQFVTLGTGGLSFDAEAWRQAAASNASWNSASWSSASWSSASWSSASWSSASWSSASWSSASWSSASWSSASWSSASEPE
ncbi:MAG: S8 family serine peptidase [Thermoleophilia bacterium]|nr:S8 family serine peptidase [Thermoleophilia bacterium]